MADKNLKAALAEFIQENMPWPFSDVSRHDDEGIDTAWAIAEEIYPRLEREFADLTGTAKRTFKRKHPDHASPATPQEDK